MDQINQSANNLEGNDQVDFFNHICKNNCKWFEVLNEIYGDKPSSTALWTNKTDTNGEDSIDSSQGDNDDLLFRDDDSDKYREEETTNSDKN